MRGFSDLSLFVLEDDTLCLEEITEYLARHCASCIGASSSEEARRALRRAGADVLVVDMELPGISGLDFVQRHCGKAAFAKTVVITGHYGRANDVTRCYGARPIVLKKPFSLLALHDAIAETAGVDGASLVQ